MLERIFSYSPYMIHPAVKHGKCHEYSVVYQINHHIPTERDNVGFMVYSVFVCVVPLDSRHDVVDLFKTILG
jgi:hypothetical protein